LNDNFLAQSILSNKEVFMKKSINYSPRYFPTAGRFVPVLMPERGITNPIAGLFLWSEAQKDGLTW